MTVRWLYLTAAAIELLLGVIFLRSDDAKFGGAVFIALGIVFLVAFAFTYAEDRP